MDRRRFLTLGATGAATALGVTAWGATALASGRTVDTWTMGRLRATAGLLWAAELSRATDSYGAGFGNVQTQYGGGDIRNNGPGIPVVDHPKLGRALKIALADHQERWEAAPGAGDDLREGDDRCFRVDFVLAPDFPIGQSNPFCLLNQIHQAADIGSPPIEFDVHDRALWVRGASTAYQRKLAPVATDTVYKLVYRVRFSAAKGKSRLSVWLNDTAVLSDYAVLCPTLVGGNSYWKGATMYCDPDIPPLTVYQNAHRIGTTYDSVNT